jgi:hypothetical protein
MNRFFGMMPTSEIKRMQSFKVGFEQLTVTIQAGENGWTILYADSSSKYKDVVDTTDNNFDKAMEVLKLDFDNINPVAVKFPEEVRGEVREERREERMKVEVEDARNIMEEECGEEIEEIDIV